MKNEFVSVSETFVMESIIRTVAQNQKPKMLSVSHMMMDTLEPRIMFDGAAVAAVVEAATAASDSLADSTSDVLSPVVADVGASKSVEIVFVDTRVEDTQVLTEGISANAEVVYINGQEDGLSQINQALAGRSGIDAIHIVSHGEAGTLFLGSSRIDIKALGQRAADLQSIAPVLDVNADILLYGCDVGAGTKGQDFITALAAATGADVAASDDDTGASDRGGDWDLERTTGQIEATRPFAAKAISTYGNLLAAPTATNLSNTVNYTEGDASVALTNIVITDSDVGDTLTATLTLVNETAGALTASSGNGETYNATTGVWTASGTLTAVNAALAAVAFTPNTNNDVDTYITTHVQDAAATGPTDGVIVLNVTPTEDAATITSAASATATENTAFSFTATGADLDGDVITYTVTGAPSWLTVGGSTPIDTITGTLGVRTDITDATTRANTAGDGGQVLDSTNRYPAGFDWDSNGNFYYADTSNRVIRKVDSAGITTIVAGQLGVSGNAGNAGESGQATSAALGQPMDVKFDSSGNMYIADYNNHAIRKIATDGTITTVFGVIGSSGTDVGVGVTVDAAGKKFSFPWAIEIDDNDVLYVGAAGNNTVYKITITAGTPQASVYAGSANGTVSPLGDGLAANGNSAHLNSPMDSVVDKSGNTYIADRYHNVIRKVDGATGIISTYAGTTYTSVIGTPAQNWAFMNKQSSGDNVAATDASVKLAHPWGVALDDHGNLYFTEEEAQTIRRVDADTGILTTVSGTALTATDTTSLTTVQNTAGDGGAAANATLNSPKHLALDSSGNIFVTDVGNWVHRKITNGIRFSGTPNPNDVGTYNLVISANDGTTTTQQNFTLVVNGNGPPPPAPSSAPPPVIADGPLQGDGGVLPDGGANGLVTIINPSDDTGPVGTGEPAAGLAGFGLDNNVGIGNTPIGQPSQPVGNLPGFDSGVGATLTQASQGGFQVVVAGDSAGANQGSQGLFVFHPMTDTTFSTGTIQFQIPADAFADSDSAATVRLQASQADGQPLPNWLSFDAETGTFTGELPPGLEEAIQVRVVARDSLGREATTTFRFVPGKGDVTPTPQDGNNTPNDTGNQGTLFLDPSALNEKIALDLGRDDSKGSPKGKSAFSEQLAAASRSGFGGRNAALLKAAQHASQRTG